MLNFWLGVKSTEGLTRARSSASKMAHFQGCWQKTSICHRLFGRSSQLLTTCPIIGLSECSWQLTCHRASVPRERRKKILSLQCLLWPSLRSHTLTFPQYSAGFIPYLWRGITLWNENQEVITAILEAGYYRCQNQHLCHRYSLKISCSWGFLNTPEQ